MRTRLFVLVPSGHRKSWGSSWSGESARAFISSLAFCLVSGVLLKNYKKEMYKVFLDISLKNTLKISTCLFLNENNWIYLSTKMVWLNSWHEEMRKASRDSILLTGEDPHIIMMRA